MLDKAIAALVAAGLLFGAGWTVNGWRADAEIASLKSGYDKTAADASEKARQIELGMRDKLAQIDKLQTDLEHAKSENQALSARLSSGTQRVYVRASCPASGGVPAASPASSVDAPAGYAELDGSVASALAGIASDGDEQIRKLNALQQYVNEVCLGTH